MKNLYDQTGFLISILVHDIERIHRRFVESIGLTVPQSKVITYLFSRRDEDVFQIDIEKHLKLKGATITGIINNLMRSGFIKRVVSEKDKRYKKIVLTDKGKSTYDVVSKSAFSIEERLVKGMSEEEKQQLQILIRKALKNMED